MHLVTFGDASKGSARGHSESSGISGTKEQTKERNNAKLHGPSLGSSRPTAMYSGRCFFTSEITSSTVQYMYFHPARSLYCSLQVSIHNLCFSGGLQHQS
jgi:hypothetical protein